MCQLLMIQRGTGIHSYPHGTYRQEKELMLSNQLHIDLNSLNAPPLIRFTHRRELHNHVCCKMRTT